MGPVVGKQKGLMLCDRCVMKGICSRFRSRLCSQSWVLGSVDALQVCIELHSAADAWLDLGLHGASICAIVLLEIFWKCEVFSGV